MGSERVCPACRITRLSRYNSDPVCSSCLSKSCSGGGVVVPQWVWDSAPLRRALADVDLGAYLAIVRTSAELSQMDLAMILGWEQSAVARVENGTRNTLYDIRKLLAATDALDMPREALAPLLFGNPGATIESEEDMDRRQFGGALLGVALTAGLGRVQVPIKVDSAHLRYLRATVDRLYRKDQEVGGAALARGALRQYHRARRMLDESDYSDRIGNKLMSAAGDLAVCVGWLSYDAGDQTLSRQLYSEALLLASESGNDALSVRVMEKMSLQSVYLARDAGRVKIAREAVRLSGRAAELARYDPSSRLHALIAAREAISYATLGDRHGFNAAITQAWREMDHSVSDNDPVWLQFVTRSEISVHEAKGQAYLGNLAAAADLYRQSLDSADLPPRNRANYRAQLAATLVTSGATADAITEGLAVLPTLEGKVASPRTFRELQPVRIVAEQEGFKDFCIRYDKAVRGSVT